MIREFPFYNKILILISSKMFIMDLFGMELFSMFCMNPQAIIEDYQIWRFISSPFFNQNVLSLLMSILISITDSSVLERIIGSSTVCLTLFLKSVLFNGIYFLFIGILDLLEILGSKTATQTGGLWPFLAIDLVSRTFSLPNGERQIFQCSQF